MSLARACLRPASDGGLFQLDSLVRSQDSSALSFNDDLSGNGPDSLGQGNSQPDISYSPGERNEIPEPKSYPVLQDEVASILHSLQPALGNAMDLLANVQDRRTLLRNDGRRIPTELHSLVIVLNESVGRDEALPSFRNAPMDARKVTDMVGTLQGLWKELQEGENGLILQEIKLHRREQILSQRIEEACTVVVPTRAEP